MSENKLIVFSWATFFIFGIIAGVLISYSAPQPTSDVFRCPTCKTCPEAEECPAIKECIPTIIEKTVKVTGCGTVDCDSLIEGNMEIIIEPFDDSREMVERAEFLAPRDETLNAIYFTGHPGICLIDRPSSALTDYEIACYEFVETSTGVFEATWIK